MKKHTLKISTMSVLCVLCAGLATNAMAAPAVRTLGGAGTYSGASAASASTRVGPTRAGSLRVTPSSARLITSNSGSASGSATSTSGGSQRLSIGKYLGGATTTATTSGGSATPGSTTSFKELEQRVDELEGNIGTDTVADSLSGRVAALENFQDKQIQGSADGIVDIADDGTVSIDVEKLMETVVAKDLNSRETEIRYTEDKNLQWRYTTGDDTEWHTLLNGAALTGDYATANDLSTAIQNLANTYATKGDVQTALNTMSDDINAALDLKADKATTYTKTEVDAAITTGVGTVDLSTYDAHIANNDIHVTTADKATWNAKQDAIGDLADIRSGAAAGATAVQPSALDSKLTSYSTTAQMDAKLADKANSADVYTKGEIDTALDGISGEAGSIATQINTALEPYSTTAEMNTELAKKQNSLTEAQLSAVNSGIDTTKVGQIATNKADIAAIQAGAQLLEDKITLKANQNYVETELGTLSNAVQSKQDKLTETQLAAVNSGVTSTVVAQVEANKDAIAIQDGLIAGKQDALTFDTTPTANSTNPVTSGGIYTAISAVSGDVDSISDQIDNALADYTTTADLESNYALKTQLPTIDSALSLSSTNPVQNKVVSGALDDKVPFGTVPTPGQYVLGFVDGVQMYIPIVDANGNSGNAIVAATGQEP